MAFNGIVISQVEIGYAVGGLLVGFLFVWIISRGNRKRANELAGRLSQADETVLALESELADVRSEMREQAAVSEQQIAELDQQLVDYQELKMRMETVEEMLAETKTELERETERFTSLLAEAEAEHERLETTLRETEARHEEQLNAIEAETSQRQAEAEQTRAEATKRVAVAQASISQYEAFLAESQEQANRRQAEAEEIINEQKAELERLREELTDLLSRPQPPREDPLEQISGIGPTFARRLRDAGVRTFDALAQLSPYQVRDIVRPEFWQRVDIDDWLRQANNFSILRKD